MCKEISFIRGYCGYCHEPIYEYDGYIEADGKLYHYSEQNALENCFFPESLEEEK